MTEQEKTISDIERTMRNWIEEQIPHYKKMEPSQQVTTVQGEKVMKANPAIQEIRAAFKDYCYIVKTMHELAGNEDDKNVSSLEDLKKKFRIA